MSYKYEHAKVARVIDGDTVVLDIDMGNRITWTAPFRLAGINAPERGHPGAEAARLYLIELLAGGIAVAETLKPDKYGRWLARIYINVGPDAADECDVSARMVAAGHAVPYVFGMGWPVMEGIMRGRIKRGAEVFHDRHFGTWPSCCPPLSEYAGEEYRFEAKDPGMVFDVSWTGRRWDCKADGYGMLRSRGEAGEYGNGSVFVLDRDGVALLDTEAVKS